MDEMLAHPALRGVSGHFLLAEAVRAALAALREGILSGTVSAVSSADALAQQVLQRLARDAQNGLRRVINGTGIVLHTNLGRAPLAQEALDAIIETARGYANLEYDITAGARGSRMVFVEDLLVRLTGAEAALVVNNNAAAVMLALAAVASGQGVITSRGELVEIGGAFRIPDVCEQSGCRLIEVGTTNKTHLRDYEAALQAQKRNTELSVVGEVLAGAISAIESEGLSCAQAKRAPSPASESARAGAILRVHASNFKMTGFVSRPSLKDLAALAQSHGVPLIEDLGSGQLVAICHQLNSTEPTVANSIRDGADVVTFSGDKLLGGPQAGIIVGRADLIANMKKHPLARALRIDKLSLAALEATLRLYLDTDVARQRIPTLQMLGAMEVELEEKAERLAQILHSTTAVTPRSALFSAHTLPTTSQAGGGAQPGEDLPSYAVAITHPGKSAAEIEKHFRNNTPPIIGRITREVFLLDVRTLDEADFPTIAARCVQLCGGEA